MSFALRLKSRPRKTQPPYGTSVDLASPLANRLLFGRLGGVSRNIDGTPSSYDTSTVLVNSGGVANKFATNQYARHANGVTSGDMTLFVIATAIANSGVIFGTFNPAVNMAGNYISIESNNTICAVSSDAANWSLAVGPTYVSGRRYAICATFKAGGGRSIYIDGVKIATNTTARNPTGMSDLLLGAYEYYSSGLQVISFLNGTIVCPLLFNRILSDSEIKAISGNSWQVFAP